MAAKSTAQAYVVNTLRWVARIGSGLFALALIVFGGLGSFDWARMSAGDIAMLALTAVAIISLILAWFWELAGGALLLGVAVVILGIELSKGVVDGGPFVFAILGAMFLFCWWASRPRAVRAA